MAFNQTIPKPGDNLNISQGDLLANNVALNTIFGIDHYPFIDNTANRGFHNTVTMPAIIGGVDPVTTINPVIYGIVKGNIPLFQYSKGPIVNATQQASTPITNLHSPLTPITIASAATTNVFDFSGLGICFATLYASAFVSNTNLEVFIKFDGTNLTAVNVLGTGQLIFQISGTTLQIKNNSSPAVSFTNVYWTLRFHRIQ